MRQLIALLITFFACSTAHAEIRPSIVGLWIARSGDTTYTMRLRNLSVDTPRTIESVSGTLTTRTSRADRVTTRTVPVWGQLIIPENQVVTLSFGERGKQTEFATGLNWGSYLELLLFSVRPKRGLDFITGTNFQRVDPPTTINP